MRKKCQRQQRVQSRHALTGPAPSFPRPCLPFSPSLEPPPTCAEVPPGRFVSQGLVRWCAQGFYRESYVNYEAAVAQICLACQPGITTPGAGAKLAADCNRVLPGHGIQTLTNVTGPQDIPALPVSGGGLPTAGVCSIGFYSSGGFCVQCPAGSITRNLGAKAIEECGELSRAAVGPQ